MITAVFTSGFDHTEVSGLWQWDYGQKLRIQGLSLPPAVEIHFSLNKSGGNSESRVGVTKDGVTDVPIPDSMLENGGTIQNYYIYAFIYITDETSGKTVKWVQLHVNSRPKPEAFDSPEEAELFRDAIAAVNESAGRAETAEKSAEAWAHGRVDYPERDGDNAKFYSDKAGEKAEETASNLQEVNNLANQVKENAETVASDKNITEEFKNKAGESAKNAAVSETNAALHENNAKEAQTKAETAQRIAEKAKEQVAKDKEEVLLAKNAVKESEKNVTENKEYVRRTVENFTSLAENAVDNVNVAGQNQVNNIEKAGQAALDNIGNGVDEGLTQSGKAADAKKTGERIDELKGDIVKQKLIVGDGITKGKSEVSLNFNEGQGVYVNGTKIGIATTSNSKYAVLDVLEGDAYTYKGNYTKDSDFYAPIIFTDLDGNIKGTYFKESGHTINTEIPESPIEVPSGATKLYINSASINVVYPPSLYKFSGYEPLTDAVIRNKERITNLENKEDEKQASIILSSKIYAIVGDTLQIFKDSIVDADCDFLWKIECAKGKQYPRYWEYTPNASDVGTTNFTISLLDYNGTVIDNKVVSLITKTASDNTINILNVGDSTMYGGKIPIELSRRLKGTNGVATSPEPLNLSNINLVGRLKNTDKTVGWEGTGGWTYANYLSEGNHAVRFNVSNANAISLGDLIRVSATNSKGYYQFQVVEINVTSGIGNIRAMFHTTPWTSTFSNEVASSGNITNSNGINVGEYTSYSEEYFQPFWNNTTNSFDIATYVNQYCNGKCDYIFILLGINSLFIKKPWDNIESIFADCKSLLRNIHEQLPNTKILLSTNHHTSQNGGLGANYGCNTGFGQYDTKAINHLLNRMNTLYFTIENDSEFSGYVTVVNTHAQFDAEHGFPYENKKVNTRCDETEHVGTNGVHPSNIGYWQIADAEFRAVLGI